ncbi:kdo(2)-lipid A phosphoethanolamine 7''-transferase [Klebsiella sp. BIGb0407]|uniref:kdo(2)-lipid A phosphoethanolamine 7''-transferase n=1 Tax=Klebsiella sp. BIGb0407 TaxID=2940603 RepID=UPI002169A6B2|nr:kdo(2)-lipid A phosphoethanolamine 7''-transferase [Klebsiella sp. BIGb0407]MCS3432601.1 KDO II ethanolaminephosphotransferase [Klebsiella sp. BIGb0407]
MNKIKLISHQKLCLLLALYVGLLLNITVFYQRFSSDTLIVWKELSAIAEVVACVLVTFFLLRILSLFGRAVWRILATLVVVISVAASYYMTFLNVVIGYGIVVSVMTTDIDLSKEVIGYKFILWIVLVSALPVYMIWRNTSYDTLIRQLITPGQRIKNIVIILCTVLLVWGPLRILGELQDKSERGTTTDTASYGGVVANSYLPSNWVSALGLYAWAKADESGDSQSLLNPAKQFSYVAPENVEDTYVVFIIGETTRWDHMGMLGYERDTTPKLSQEKNLVAFRGESCDTATKLSLRCMFVREGGASDNPQRTLKEQNVFSVLKQLGFSSNIYAMQSEVWFYKNSMPDSFAFREEIAANPRNRGKTVDDMILIDEVSESLKQHPKGKHLIILHTKGSHFSYAQRYPRSFAKWTPECVSIDNGCSKESLINAFDNSVLYTDTMISSVLDELRNKRAIVFYASDHGESISESTHLHGTPRHMAPPEQFRVPLLVWASDKFLENPKNKLAFEHLQEQAGKQVSHRHVELYDSILGCLGYTSPDGGINQNNNWCHIPENSTPQ